MNLNRVTPFRPICLCNIIYKIGSKTIVNRLKLVLPSMLCSIQSAFVPHRLITDDVLIAFDLNHYINSKNKSRNDYIIGFSNEITSKLRLQRGGRWRHWEQPKWHHNLFSYPKADNRERTPKNHTNNSSKWRMWTTKIACSCSCSCWRTKRYTTRTMFWFASPALLVWFSLDGGAAIESRSIGGGIEVEAHAQRKRSEIWRWRRWTRRWQGHEQGSRRDLEADKNHGLVLGDNQSRPSDGESLQWWRWCGGFSLKTLVLRWTGEETRREERVKCV